MMEMVVTTGAVKGAKLQSNCYHQQTHTQLFTGQMPFLLSNQQCQSSEYITFDLTLIRDMTDCLSEVIKVTVT